jgi:LysM repeat protein
VLKVARGLQSPEIPLNTPGSYQVQAGDSLGSIAKAFSLSVADLRQFNSLNKSSIIYVGQNLSLRPIEKIPAEQKATSPSLDSKPSASTDLNLAADPIRPSGVCTIHGVHTVQAGESVARIAAVYGVSTQAVLSSNSLSWSSTIYVSQRLIIPGVHSIQNCPLLTKLTPQMQANAEVIFRVGKSLNVSDYGIVIALATAMQESRLQNIDYGDRDSVGLFQQRPSQGWGSQNQIMDSEYSARAFFGGPSGPNFGRVRGLLDIPDWPAMSLSKAAQAVQVSAFPDAYQKWELSAWSWFDLIDSGAKLNG